MLNYSLLEALESFQAELGRRVLKLPKFTSNTIPLLVLNWPTVCTRVFCNKLSFLSRVCNGDSTSLRTQVFRSIAASDATSMNIVRQCHFLDSVLGSEFTDEVLNEPNLCLRNLKKRVIDADCKRVEEKSKDHPSLLYILRVAKENLWLKFWDVALEHGLDGSKSSMALLKVLSLTLCRDRQCPVSNCAHTVPQDSPLCEHLFECHSDVDPSVTPAFVTDNIISSTSNPEHFLTLIPFGLSLLKVLPF